MKKYALIFLSLIICFNVTDARAASRGYIPKPYMGVDYLYTKIDYKSKYENLFEDQDSGYIINLGARLSEYFGLEFSYQPTLKSKKVFTDYTAKGEFAAYSLDFIGYLPNYNLSFSWLFTGGFGAYEYRGKILKYDGTKTSKSGHDTNLRMGLGMQYNFTRNFAIRVIGRYVLAESSYLKNHYDGTVGIQLTF